MNCKNVSVMLKSLYLLPPVEFKIYSMTTQFQKLSLQQKFCLSEKNKTLQDIIYIKEKKICHKSIQHLQNLKVCVPTVCFIT